MRIAVYAPFDSNLGGAYYYNLSLIKSLLELSYVSEISLYISKGSVVDQELINFDKIKIEYVDKNQINLSLINKFFTKLLLILFSINIKIPFQFLYKLAFKSDNNLSLNFKQKGIDKVFFTIPFVNPDLLDFNSTGILHDIYFLPGYIKDLKYRDLFREIHTYYFVKFSNQILTESPIGKKQISSYYKIEKRNNIEILPTGPSPFIYENNSNFLSDWESFKKDHSINSTYLFYPGHIISEKNQTFILEAVSKLISNGEELMVIFTTPSDDKSTSIWFEEIVKNLNLGNYVRIIHNVNAGILVQLYKNALCLVFSSKIGPTNMPIWEAMVLGCPVLASDIGDHEWQIGSNINLFNLEDTAKLEYLILKMEYEPKFRLGLINNGFNRIKNSGSLDKSIILNEILTKK